LLRLSRRRPARVVVPDQPRVIGPGIGGVLVRLVGAPLVILVDAVSFLGSMAFTLRIRHREEPAAKAARRPLVTEIGEGLSFVVRQPLLRRIVATTGLSNMFGNVGQAMLVRSAIRDLGLGEAGLGLTLSIGAVGGLTGALAAGTVIRVLGEGRPSRCRSCRRSPPRRWFRWPRGHTQPVAIAMLATSMAAFEFGTVIYNVTRVSFRQRPCPPPAARPDERLRPVHRVGQHPDRGLPRRADRRALRRTDRVVGVRRRAVGCRVARAAEPAAADARSTAGVGPTRRPVLLRRREKPAHPPK
jgi:hypothetical protein